jgi:hypothetical protein
MSRGSIPDTCGNLYSSEKDKPTKQSVRHMIMRLYDPVDVFKLIQFWPAFLVPKLYGPKHWIEMLHCQQNF